MPRAGVGLIVVLGIFLAGAAAPPRSAPDKPPAKSDRWGPMVVGTDDADLPGKPKTPPAAPTPARPAGEIRVDEKTKTVRIPVALTRAKGVVEWLLASGKKHGATSVLVTDHSAKDLAAAVAKAGLAPGIRPELVGDDRAKPPSGQAVEIALVCTGADGQETRTPAAKLLSPKSSGEPLGEGAWVYVGPQFLREGDVDILVTELSGSIVTTNLRDLTAMIYWVPKVPSDPPPYVTAFYASSTPLLRENEKCELEIRPASAEPSKK
jgi:hypothetical protein